MKCINNRRCFSVLAAMSLTALILSGCGSSYAVPYTANQKNSNYSFIIKETGDAEVADSFASGLCVADGDITDQVSVDTSGFSAAAIFDVNNCSTLYAKNVYTTVYPASLTKIMTAVVALKYSSPDTVLTASSAVTNLESGAQAVGLAAGDQMTLDQALHLLLIYSANDVAIMIAENVGDGVDDFVAKMNEEAASIGATNTHFVNTNGLTDSNHVTTAYDMYLIFNEALKYSEFQEIINMSSYSTEFHDASGNVKSVSVNTTNLYLNGGYSSPSNVTVIGGKTGTTTAAGHCLIMLSKDISGSPYISVVMGATDSDKLYSVMNELLSGEQSR